MGLRKPAIVFLICTSILVTISISLVKTTLPVYGVNDDKIIESLVSGEYTGEPEFMVSFSATPKIIFGITLSGLYKLNGEIPWYGIYLASIVIIGWALLLTLIFLKSNKLVFFILLILVVAYLNWFIPGMTYTSAAVIPSIGSLICLTYLVHIKKTKLSYFIFLGTIFGLGYTTRPESAFLALLACFPIILFVIIKSIKSGNIALVGKFLVSAFSLILVNFAIEQIYLSQNPEWIKFRAFESARYEVQANQVERELVLDPARFGWSVEETQMFVAYQFADKNVFTEDKLNKLTKLSRSSQDFRIDKIVQMGLNNLNSNQVNSLWTNFLISVLFLHALFMTRLYKKNSNYLFTTVLGIILVMSAFTYISAYLRLPERVTVSFYFIIVLMPIIFDPFFEARKVSTGNARTLISTLLMGLSLFFLIKQFSVQKDRNYAYTATNFLDSQITFFQSFPENKVFIGNSSQFRDQWQSPFEFNKKVISSNILSLGWHTFSPHWEKKVEVLGLDSDNFFQQVTTNENLLWVTDSNGIKQIESYYQQKNYSDNEFIRLNSIDYFGEEYSVWSLKN